jgi:hypothetical protein
MGKISFRSNLATALKWHFSSWCFGTLELRESRMRGITSKGQNIIFSKGKCDTVYHYQVVNVLVYLYCKAVPESILGIRHHVNIVSTRPPLSTRNHFSTYCDIQPRFLSPYMHPYYLPIISYSLTGGLRLIQVDIIVVLQPSSSPLFKSQVSQRA